MADLERTDKPVSILVKELANGVIGVPEIQRNYVWNATQARDLVDSLYRKYPSGLILLWRPKNNPMYGKAVTKHKTPDYLILDGQQRITALQKVLSGEINLHFHILDGTLHIFNKKESTNRLLVPLTALIKNAFKVLTDATNGIILKEDQKEQIQQNIRNICKIEDYMFPVMIMHTDDYEEITESFIRLNSKGTRLNSTELAIARLAFQWPGAVTNEFDVTLKEYAKADYDLEMNVLVRLFIIIGKFQNGVYEKSSSVFDKGSAELMDIWKRTKRSFNGAIMFLKNNAGIESSKWLTSQYVIIPLAFFFYKKDRSKITDREIAGLLLWFFITTIYTRLTGRMSNLDKDIRAISTEAPIDELIKNLYEDVSSFSVTPEMIKGAYNRSNLIPLLRIILSQRDAKDFFTGISIKTNSIGYENQIEGHHIFPKSILKKNDMPTKEYDDITNIAFISQKINNHISNADPSEYLKDIDPIRLESQLIPTYKELWKISRFNDFCEERRKLIAKAINDFLNSQLIICNRKT